MIYSECYLDKYNNVDSTFISQLIRGEKFCFKNNEINRVILPHYDELNMKNLNEQIKDDNEIKGYLNDKFADKKKPSRQFLLDIIGTVYPGYFKEVIEAQTNERFEKQVSDEKGNYILATGPHPVVASKDPLVATATPLTASKSGGQNFSIIFT